MRAAAAAGAALQGLFAVYKPPGLPWKMARDTVELHLLEGLNSLKCPQPRQQIRFQRTVSEEDGKDLTLTVNKVPMLVDHPLVLGVGHGTKMLTDWYNAHLTRTYTVNGVFGKATDDFSDRGKLIEKTTFDHITQEKLERIISVIQGSHHKALLQPPPSLSFLPRRFYGQRKEPDSSQPLCFSKSPANPRVWTTGHSMGSHKQQPLWKALLITLSLALFLLWCALRSETDMDRCANLDLKTQEAYELAVKGLIRPMEKSPPLITAVQCLRFAPPEFQLEIHCLHETQQYLRKIVHEIGLELKSSAVCTQVRRVRDGVFVLEDALLRTQWTLPNIQRAILQSKQKVDAELQNSLAPEAQG